jgi:hypothetical protein
MIAVFLPRKNFLPVCLTKMKGCATAQKLLSARPPQRTSALELFHVLTTI